MLEQLETPIWQLCKWVSMQEHNNWKSLTLSPNPMTSVSIEPGIVTIVSELSQLNCQWHVGLSFVQTETDVSKPKDVFIQHTPTSSFHM